jgi:hypothetical protein
MDMEGKVVSIQKSNAAMPGPICIIESMCNCQYLERKVRAKLLQNIRGSFVAVLEFEARGK